MDAPFNTRDLDAPRHRGPVNAWIPLAVVAAVLAVAVLGASSVTDTRDFAAKHATVVQERLL